MYTGSPDHSEIVFRVANKKGWEALNSSGTGEGSGKTLRKATADLFTL